MKNLRILRISKDKFVIGGDEPFDRIVDVAKGVTHTFTTMTKYELANLAMQIITAITHE